tara:strand:- start:314 stop:562 length:249 start_codon:yes stop_codon:yes gene_type:complete
LESLECADSSKEEELQCEPLSGTDSVKDHVGGDFEEDDAEGEHLLADIELILSDVHIFEEVVCESVGDIATIEFCIVVSTNS